MPDINSTHLDSSGRAWKYTTIGWQIIEGEYNPVVKMKLDVVVAKRNSKLFTEKTQHWYNDINKLDISNKELLPEYK